MFYVWLPRGQVWAPHCHAHHPQRGRPRLRGRARRQLRPWRQRPGRQAPHPAAQNHPDAATRLQPWGETVSSGPRGAGTPVWGLWHSILRRLVKSWTHSLSNEGLGKAPTGAPMFKRFIGRRTIKCRIHVQWERREIWACSISDTVGEQTLLVFGLTPQSLRSHPSCVIPTWHECSIMFLHLGLW